MKNRLIKSSFIYLASSVLSKSIPFLLLPVLTELLTPSEYGVLSIYLMIVTFFTAVIGMNIQNNISRNFFRVSKEELSEFIGNMLIILISLFLLCFAIVVSLRLSLNNFFSVPLDWLIIAPLTAFLSMLVNINTTVLRNENKAIMFGVFQISLSSLNVLVTVVCLLVFTLGWVSPVLGQVFSFGVVSIVSIYYLHQQNYISLKVDRSKILSILSISIPFIPHVLGSAIINLSDRLFIENLIDIDTVGIYSVGYMFGMTVILFSDAFIKAWSPWFYRHIQNPTNQVKKKIVRYTYYYIFGIFILAMIISITGVFILPFFVDEKFQAASQYIFWISIGYAIFAVYQIFFPYLVHINRTYFLALSTATAAITNLVLNYYFIDYFGAIGAAYSTVISFLVSAVMVVLYTQKKYKMPWLKIGTTT